MEQTTFYAAQVIISIIPIVGIVMGAAVIFFYLLWNHRRKSLLIKAGMYERGNFDLSAFCLLTGLLLTIVGASLTLFLMFILGSNLSLLSGIIPLSIGIGLLAYYWIKRKEKNT